MSDVPLRPAGDAPDAAGPADACTGDWPVPEDGVPAGVAAVLRLGAQINGYGLRRRLAPLLQTPLTVQQLRCLTVLVVEGTAAPQHLAELLGVSPATLTGIADRLVRAGMVDRSQDERDGRGRVLSPTPAGLRVVRELLVFDVESDVAVLGELTAEELGALVTGLGGVLRVLRSRAGTAGGAGTGPGDGGPAPS